MLTDGRRDGRMHGQTNDGRKVITIAHSEQSSGELKMCCEIYLIKAHFKESSAENCSFNDSYGICF